ncbi:MAG: hypothetical protein OEQ18_04520 [Gammaproteobacteria bacterium]|nr:hypothetical protein [Gammaproteobacteria bacterium]
MAAMDRYIGRLPLHQVHLGSLQRYIQARQRAGIKTSTINRELAVVRLILNKLSGSGGMRTD